MHLYYSGLKTLLVLLVFTLSVSAGLGDTGLVAEYHNERYASNMMGDHFVNDSSGNQFTAQISIVMPFNATGRFGKALMFDGSGVGSWMTISHNALFKPASEITIEAYVYPWFENETRQIWRKEDSTDRSLLSFQSGDICTSIGNGSSCIAFGISIDGTYAELEATADGFSDGWHHIVATYNGSNKSIWIDGSLAASVLDSGAIGTSGTASSYVGSNGGSSESFIGMIDEIRFYNRSLNPTEIQQRLNCDYYTGTTGNWVIGNETIWCRAPIHITGNLTVYANSTFNMSGGRELNVSQGIMVPETGATVQFGYLDVHAGWFFLDGADSNVTLPSAANGWPYSNYYPTTRMVLNSESANRVFRQSDGNLLHNGGTIEFRNPAQSGFQAISPLNNLIINAVGGSFDFVTNNVNLAGNLSIYNGTYRIANNQGTLYTNVNGSVTVYGNLYSPSDAGNADTIFNVTGRLEIGGNYQGGTQNHAFGSFYSWTEGTSVHSSGVTEITGRGINGVDDGKGGTVDYSEYSYIDWGWPTVTAVNGTLNFSLKNAPSDSISYIDGDTVMYFTNFVVNASSDKTLSINYSHIALKGNLTIASGQLRMDGGYGSANMTVNESTSISGFFNASSGQHSFNGAITINSGGTLGNGTSYTLDNNGGTITISSGGTLSAPNASGLFTTTGSITATGTFNHNNGTVVYDNTATINQEYTITFWKVTLSGSGIARFPVNSGRLTVEKELIANSANIQMYDNLGSPILLIGTSGSSGNITVNNSYLTSTVGNRGSTIKAVSPDYPFTVMGNSITFNTAAGSKTTISDMIYYPDLANSNSFVFLNRTTFMRNVTLIAGSNVNASYSNFTVMGNLSLSPDNALWNDTNLNVFGDFNICGDGNVTFTNVTILNSTPIVGCSANYTVRWKDVFIVDEDGNPISSALTNVTQDGTIIASGSTGSNGGLPAIIQDYSNVGGTISLGSAIIAASAGGYATNSITDNVTRSNYQLALAPSGGGQSGYTTGFSVDGVPFSTTFTPIVKVNGINVIGPWQDVQNITIVDNDTGETIANFTHDFTSLSLPTRYLKINYGSSWVGIGTREMAFLGHLNYSYSLNVPTVDAVCNTQICSGDNKLVLANCDSPDWSTTPSTQSDSVCLAAVTGSVVRDQTDLTSIIAVPDLTFVWILVIFTISYAIMRLKRE
jgi:hypothetical protein